jgi:5-methyltetrahydrofolate--homocysteine methyltransferase
MSLRLQFSEADWERTGREWSAWWAGELERPLVVLECIEPENRYDLHCSSVFLGNYPMETPADVLLNEFMSRLENTVYLGDSFPRFWPNYGPGIVAAFAGAQVHPAWDTTWFTPGQPGSIENLRVANDLPNLDNNPWWQRVVETTREAVDRWGMEVAVGLTDLGGNLDILASLRDTRQLLMDLVKSPEEVDRLVGETTQFWLECYDRLYEIIASAGRGITCWGPCWSNERGYMLQSDFSYMISPKMFERFVLPDLEACCAKMDYAFYHLDGKGQLVHVDALLSIPRLRGIQWVPGFGKPPCEEWLPLLKRIRTAEKLCQVTVNPEGALTILRELGGKGFAFVIDEPQLTPEQGKAFLEEFKRENYY